MTSNDGCAFEEDEVDHTPELTNSEGNALLATSKDYADPNGEHGRLAVTSDEFMDGINEHAARNTIVECKMRVTLVRKGSNEVEKHEELPRTFLLLVHGNMIDCQESQMNFAFSAQYGIIYRKGKRNGYIFVPPESLEPRDACSVHESSLQGLPREIANPRRQPLETHESCVAS